MSDPVTALARNAQAGALKPDGSGAMFDGIAARYDLVNRVISLGVDQSWRRKTVRSLELGPSQRVLDLATGTADLAIQVARAERTVSPDGHSVQYDVHGPLFFGSSNDLVERFFYGEDPKQIAIDLTHAQIWDASSVAALDAIETKYREHGATVTFTGLDQRSSSFHQRLTGQLGA